MQPDKNKLLLSCHTRCSYVYGGAIQYASLAALDMWRASEAQIVVCAGRDVRCAGVLKHPRFLTIPHAYATVTKP